MSMIDFKVFEMLHCLIISLIRYMKLFHQQLLCNVRVRCRGRESVVFGGDQESEAVSGPVPPAQPVWTGPLHLWDGQRLPSVCCWESRSSSSSLWDLNQIFRSLTFSLKTDVCVVFTDRQRAVHMCCNAQQDNHPALQRQSQQVLHP